ncbi:DinB family protein [Mucilaginibacter conchicola]|uniref:DinB family protein n=1 Tax=Mucilaginibacter conchicola TaxID=2303333 RepID=A0A372NRK3_9SPHI|nr:DinB family protein [Mucilaginibacter conchicola]RFZ91878.1 DinB family protein [Mucilaginibacter conchicola]
MNPVKERRAIDEALSSYRSLLDDFSDDRFAETPPIGGWSYAEVYDHILKATLGASIALERCSHNNCQPTKDGVTLIGHYTLLMGSFPPFKLKSPPETGNVKKIDKEEAKNLIIKVRKRVDGIAGQIKEAKPQSKYKHPRMGMLTALQWLKFMRIHLEHHLKQLQRIGKNFNKS